MRCAVMTIVSEQTDEAEVVSPGTVAVSGERSCLRILVAEDDREMNAVLTEALSGDGHKTIAVDSGIDALAVLFNAVGGLAPDAAVMDVRMPGLSGIRVLAALRRSGSRIPVIIITGFGDESLHREAMALGADAVFDKPFDVDDLRRTLGDLLRAHGRSK